MRIYSGKTFISTIALIKISTKNSNFGGKAGSSGVNTNSETQHKIQNTAKIINL